MGSILLLFTSHCSSFQTHFLFFLLYKCVSYFILARHEKYNKLKVKEYQAISGCTCSTLTRLTFGKWFNHEVNFLPSSLKHLKFGYNFNCDMTALPSSVTHLTHLTFGIMSRFDEPLDLLPPSLAHLTFQHLLPPIGFGSYFNRSVDAPLYLVIILIGL